MSEQPTSAEPEDRVCVLFREAILWIAHRNFSGFSIGLLRLSERPDEDDLYYWAQGRYDFAQDLLLDYAARSKIRIYSKIPHHRGAADAALGRS